MFVDKTKFEKIGSLTNTGSTDLVFVFPQRAHVKRVVLIATTPASAQGTITVKKNGTSIGTFKNAASVAAKGVNYADVGNAGNGGVAQSDGSTLNTGGETYVDFATGDYLTLTPANTASSGVYDVFIEYIPEGLDEVVSSAAKQAFTAA